MVNRDGESGHPCLVPLCSAKLCDVSPFVVTVADGDVYKILIQLINDSPKPNFCNVVNKNFQLTLSKAFSASNVAMRVSFCCTALMSKALNPYNLQVLLDACLPFIKPV